jgi:hypothetical protein
MSLRHFAALAAVFAGLMQQPAFAQDQPIFLRSICTKTQPGKGTEFEELLSRTALKAAQYNISQGKLARYIVLRNMYPGGSSAECDYISSFLYAGAPAENTTEVTTAAWANARVGMPYPAFLARLNSIAHTVRVEIYGAVARTGVSQLGDYVVLNRMQVQDQEAWGELESKIWKPIQDARIKVGQLRAWGSYAKVLPSGSGEPYSAMTADIYPSWEALWNQKPITGYVQQAHPTMSEQEFNDKTSKAREIVSREVFKIVQAEGTR